MGQTLEKKIEKKLIRSFSEPTDVVVIGSSLTWMLESEEHRGYMSTEQIALLTHFDYDFHITDDYHDFYFELGETRYSLDGNGSVSVYTLDEFSVIKGLLINEEFEEDIVLIHDFKGEIFAQIRDFDTDEVVTFTEKEDEYYLMHLTDRRNDDDDDDFMENYYSLAIGECSSVDTFILVIDEEIEED